MNRHRCGESHGLSIQTLERHFSFERFLILDNGETIDYFPLERHQPGRRPLTRLLRKTIVDARNRLRPKRHPRGRYPHIQRLRKTKVKGRPKSHISLPHECGLIDKPFSQSVDSVLPWRFMHNYTAKIINNELFLARFHFIAGPSVSPAKFKKLLDSIGLPVCRHLLCSPTGHSPHLFTQYRIPQVDNSRGNLLDCHRAVGSCPFCFTDYMISIRRSKGKDDWNLELTTYHRLGSCRSPDDPIWRCLTDYSLTHIDCQEFGAGEIRRQWHQSHGEDVDDEPQWVLSFAELLSIRSSQGVVT